MRIHRSRGTRSRAAARFATIVLVTLVIVGLFAMPEAARAQLFEPRTPFATPSAAPEVAAPAIITSPASSTAPVASVGESISTDAQFRALWVDSYREGFKTPAQVDRLLADARRANVNALLVQVRRSGGSLFLKSTEPRVEDPSLAAGFDPLAYLIEQAHAESPRLEVHAWMNSLPIWGDDARRPADPRHVFNEHGPGAQGREDWLTRREDGATYSHGYFLDPGHPDAARYTLEVALNIVREYDVDGVHLDYVRYPEKTDGFTWGYNQTSIDRFNARYSKQGKPAATDLDWAQWRRDQVTQLVRQIYLGTMALKPAVKLSAAVIPWGDGPRTDADWKRMAAYGVVYQDWRAWLEEGIVDLVMPMNYFREDRAPQPDWFDRWVAWQRDHAYGRQMVPGVAVYMNDPSESVSQIRRAMAPGPSGSRVAGVALFSYAVARRGTGDESTPRDKAAEVWSALTEAGPVNGSRPPFVGRVATPEMAWKVSPQGGSVVLRAPGLDGARIDLSGPAQLSGETDGSGLFGALSVPPGRYGVTVRHRQLGEPRSLELEVTPGGIATFELAR